ncbi:MAG TPA: hypothetical protein VE981_10145 [Planctomycetota bacterium]|nr:hypothetical protein [Planctomycetota bacterium]
MATRLATAADMKTLAGELGQIVQVNVYMCCDGEGGTTPGGGGPGRPTSTRLAKALRFTIKILMENLDTQTLLQVFIRVGEEVLAQQVVMHGEKPEFYIGHAEVLFNRGVDLQNEQLTFEMVHPGIPSNEEPHVRLQVTDFGLVMDDGSVRGASVDMEESPIFTDKHHEDYPPGHWNFVDGNRSSGRVLIHVS